MGAGPLGLGLGLENDSLPIDSSLSILSGTKDDGVGMVTRSQESWSGMLVFLGMALPKWVRRWRFSMLLSCSCVIPGGGGWAHHLWFRLWGRMFWFHRSHVGFHCVQHLSQVIAKTYILRKYSLFQLLRSMSEKLIIHYECHYVNMYKQIMAHAELGRICTIIETKAAILRGKGMQPKVNY